MFACVCIVCYIRTFDSGYDWLTLGPFGKLPVSFLIKCLLRLYCLIAVVVGGRGGGVFLAGGREGARSSFYWFSPGGGGST